MKPSLAIACAAFASLLACAPRPNLVGNWQAQGGSERIEFRSNGEVSGTDRYGRPLTGRFEQLDPGHVRLKMTITSLQNGMKMVDNSEGVYAVQVGGNELALTEPGGGPTTRFRKSQ